MMRASEFMIATIKETKLVVRMEDNMIKFCAFVCQGEAVRSAAQSHEPAVRQVILYDLSPRSRRANCISFDCMVTRFA